MKRREFLTAASAGAIAAIVNTTFAAAEPAGQAPRLKGDAAGESSLAPPPPGVEYFTQERLEKAIDTTTPIDSIHCQTIAYTFNPWHPSPFMEKTFGKGWTEYETMRMARLPMNLCAR